MPRSRPTLFALVALSALTLSATGTFVGSLTRPYLVIPSTTSASSSSKRPEDRMIDLVNAERGKRGLEPVHSHPLLQLAAQNHANDMAVRKYFSHYSPERTTVKERVRATGYFEPSCADCGYSAMVSENIGKGSLDPAIMLKRWMNSPDHRKALLRADYRHVGIGRNGTVWVQVFGVTNTDR